jgi:primosomal protein N'
MNHFHTSDGERVAKSTIDYRVREAKKKKIELFLDEHGYIFCEECERNANSGVYIDCSHDISVDECQKSGRCELAWDVDNITMRCRKCHNKHD